MIDQPRITFSAGGRRFCILFHDSNFRAYEIAATLIAESGAMRGELETTLDGINDLASLLSVLTALEREVGSVCDDVWDIGWPVCLKFALDKLGHLWVDVELGDEDDEALRLKIYADQSYLPNWIEKVRDIVGRVQGP